MKQCPFCGEDIEESSKKCKYCNEWLDEENVSFNSLNWGNIIFPGLLKLVKVALFFVLFVALFILGYNEYQSQNDIEEVFYKSITPLKSYENLAINYSDRERIDIIIRQENDLKEYLSGMHSRAQKTGLFIVFYKNLKLIEKAFNEYDAYNEFNRTDLYIETTERIANEIMMTRLRKNHIISKPVYLDKADTNNMATYFIITNPHTDILEIIYMGEYCWGFHINDTYLANTYSKYLNKCWKEYMANKKRVCDDLNHRNYFDDGVIIPDGLTVAKWAVMWEQFIKKYPNFELLDDIKKDLEEYQSCILHRPYATIFDEKEQKSVLSKDLREGCEYYIKNGEKNTEIYNKIKRDYEIWKKNNFEYNKETEKLY